MKLAFFDSGIGGLSVLHHAMKLLPQEEFIFFADEDNVPYGTKSRAEVLGFVDEAFKFLTAQNVSAIVVACNTATSVAVRDMRKKYSLPIIGMEPALKVALDTFPGKKVLVAATAITVTGEKIRRLIERLHAQNLAELKALSKLVDFAERREFNSADVENYLRAELSGVDFKNFSSLVLGCTHFNYFKDTLRKILPPHVKILDGNSGTVNELIRRTNLQPARSEKFPDVKFFYSGRLVTDAAELERLETFIATTGRNGGFDMKIYRAAIFDLDGTLTDTLEDLHAAVNEMLTQFNFPTRTLDEVRQFVGNGARKLMIRALPADKINFVDEALAVYNDCYARRCTDKVKPYAGIPELLENLSAKKIPLGICTNKQHFAAVEIAEKILASVKFAQVSGDEPNQPRKPDPTRPLAVAKSCGVAPEDVAYFGDTAVDMNTAHNAGFLSVGVTWGFRPRSELVESGAEIIVDSPQEILTRINFG